MTPSTEPGQVHFKGHGISLSIPQALVVAAVSVIGMRVFGPDPSTESQNIRSLTAAVEGLSAKVANLEATVKARDERQDKLETSISLVSSQVSEIRGELKGLQK
jgi:outer membrane murein-binding lipoprotein Lpp